MYVEKTDDFSNVPDQLRTLLGTPILVMTIDLDQRQKLGVANLAKVKKELEENGFYLQIPPPEDNLLDLHKAEIGYQEPDKS